MGPEKELGNLVSHPDYVLIVIPTWLSKQYMSIEKEKSIQCRKEVKITPTKHQRYYNQRECFGKHSLGVFWSRFIDREGNMERDRLSNLPQVSKPGGQDSSPLCPRVLCIQCPSTFISLNLLSIRHPMYVHAWKFL